MEYTDQRASVDHVIVRTRNDVGVEQDDAPEGKLCDSLEVIGIGLGLKNAAAGAGMPLAAIACGAFS